MAIENYCFCELVPLYVLDLLTDSKRVWVERELQQSPELAEELAHYQTAATAIAYGVPIVPIATNLKDRLFARLQLSPPPQPQKQSEIKKSLTAVRTQDFQWHPHSIPGIEVATLHTDNMKREVVGILRAAPGVSYLLDSHATGEEIYILEGDLVVEGQVYGAFDYIRSKPGSTDAPYTTGGCMFFFRTSMDDEYIA